MNWETVPLQDVLVQRVEEVVVEPTAQYPMVGVLGFGRGVYFRELLAGSDTSYTHFYRVRHGDLVVSRVKAWEGALGVVPLRLDGHFVSKEFPAFTARDGQASVEFINLFFRSPTGCELLRRATTGIGARRERVKENQFLAIEVPLPPAGEQRRIVTQLEEVLLKLREATGLREEVASSFRSLKLALVVGGSPARRRLRDLVDWVEDLKPTDPSFSYQFAGVMSFGRGLFRADVKPGLQIKYRGLSRLRHGDFIFPKLMAWEGAFGMVPKDLDGAWVSPEFPVFRVRDGALLPEVLDAYFRSATCLPAVRAASTGTNVRRRRLHPHRFLDLEVPVPPMPTQLALRRLYEQEDALRPAWRTQEAALEASEAAVLNAAFSGHL